MSTIRVVGEALDELFSGADDVGRTDAVVVHAGETVVERYGGGTEPITTLRSWAIAKSMLHAAVGILVADGQLALHEPAPVPEWADPSDPRHDITLRQLLTMRSGLEWVEDPGPTDAGSDVAEMLHGRGGRPHDDTAAYAANKPLLNEPGTVTNYSSGASAIVSRLVGDVVGRGTEYEQFLRSRLFAPLGMASATPKYDPSGIWMASSFCFCTAREFARFGELYLADGCWQGEQLLTPEWVSTAAVETGRHAGRSHTCHWWRFGKQQWGAFVAAGWLGQYVIVVPALELVVVRLGQTVGTLDGVNRRLNDLIASFE